MSWGPGQRLHHDALIGFTDGKFYHREPTVRPENLFEPGGRYRPQQIRGFMGNFGQLLYDLTGPVGLRMDPGTRCQAWAMQEPDPIEWTEGLSLCPCNRAQAIEDLSFLQDSGDPGPRVKTLRGQRWGSSGGHVFQSILSNKHGSGKRCVYELDGPLLAGYSERYLFGHSFQEHIGTHSCKLFKDPLSSTCYTVVLSLFAYLDSTTKHQFVFLKASNVFNDFLNREQRFHFLRSCILIDLSMEMLILKYSASFHKFRFFTLLFFKVAVCKTWQKTIIVAINIAVQVCDCCKMSVALCSHTETIHTK